jgi:hypothetical protein
MPPQSTINDQKFTIINLQSPHTLLFVPRNEYSIPRPMAAGWNLMALFTRNSFRVTRHPFLLCSQFILHHFPHARRKKDIMAPLRAPTCVDQTPISRLPLLPPRPPLERTDGRTWLINRLPKSAHFGSFFIDIRI